MGGFPQGSRMPPTQPTHSRPLLLQPLVHDNRPPGTGDSPVLITPGSVVMTPNVPVGIVVSSILQEGTAVRLTLQGNVAASSALPRGVAASSTIQGGVATQEITATNMHNQPKCNNGGCR